MGGVFAMGCVAVLAAFGMGASAVSHLLSRSVRGSSDAFLGDAGVRTGRIAALLRNGVGFVEPVSRAVLGSKTASSLLGEGASMCVRRGYPTTADRLATVVVAALLALTAASLALTRSPVAALAVPACSVVLLAAVVHGARDARQEEVRESVPEVLRSIGACLQTGYTLMQTFDQVSREVDGPLKTAFSQAARLLEAGRPVPEALSKLREAAAIPELTFVAVALQVQHEAGGSMRKVLDAARDAVEGEIELKRSLRVQTAQAKLSARIVSVMPIVLIALFSVISEGFLEPFFSSAAGVALLLVAVAMQVAGVVAVRRMLSLEVAL